MDQTGNLEWRWLPVISAEEFAKHIEEEDFPVRYGNPVRIHTEDGHDLVCLTIELYERMCEGRIGMGYTTYFSGEIQIDPPISKDLSDYINAFSHTRHVRRDIDAVKRIFPDWEKLCWKGNPGAEGEYFIVPERKVNRPYIDSEETFDRWREQTWNANGILDDNVPPAGVPGLWCHWVINENGKLCWSGTEKFYDYDRWLEYLIERFFIPEGYTLNGRIFYAGERMNDIGYLHVTDNHVRKMPGCIIANWEGELLSVEMPEELKEDLEEILQKRSGISLEKALQLYFRWIAECPDEFEKWIKEIKLI